MNDSICFSVKINTLCKLIRKLNHLHRVFTFQKKSGISKYLDCILHWYLRWNNGIEKTAFPSNYSYHLSIGYCLLRMWRMLTNIRKWSYRLKLCGNAASLVLTKGKYERKIDKWNSTKMFAFPSYVWCFISVDSSAENLWRTYEGIRCWGCTLCLLNYDTSAIVYIVETAELILCLKMEWKKISKKTEKTITATNSTGLGGNAVA